MNIKERQYNDNNVFIRSNLVAGLWVETVASATGWSVALEKDGIVADA
jgi:predicted secreted protein